MREDDAPMRLKPIKEAAESLGVHVRTCERWSEEGVLPPIVKLGTRNYFVEAEFKACIANLPRGRSQRHVKQAALAQG
jgi:excisionase family DNA binding protein